jgi:catechol 2,3-dioxygenase-like lactoylglutathione lyase family enzyme
MITGGNATVYVSSLDEAIQFYTERLGLQLTNRFGEHWATVQAGPSYWTQDDVGAGLTIGLHPPSPKHPAPGTVGGVGFGLETYVPIEQVSARLTERGVRVDAEIIRFEAGNVFSLVDQDGLPTYVHEFPPNMLPDTDLGAPDTDESKPVGDMIAGGHAIVYVSNMDAAIRFYTEVLGLRLTNRYGDHWATVEAGRLVIGIHPQTPRTPTPGTKGSVMLGLTIDEPVERVVSRLAASGVRTTGPVIRGEGGTFVEIEDPSGNSIYLWEEQPSEPEKGKTRQAVLSSS